MGVDPKYAPLVAIFTVVMMGWIAIQLLTSMRTRWRVVLYSAAEGAPVAIIGYILYGMVSL